MKANEDKFLLENTIKEVDAEIFKVSMDNDNFTKFVLFKEPKREVYYMDKEIVEDELMCELACCQELLLSRCKAYNKINNKKKIIQEQIKEIKNKRARKKPPLNFFDTMKDEASDISNITGTKNEVEYENLDTEFLDELNSDSEEEVQFDNKVKQNKYLQDFSEISNKIPKIDLKQIEFNKIKVKPGELTEIKLSRRNNDSSLERCVKTFRDKIKASKMKIKKKIEKIKLLEIKIEKMNLKLHEGEFINVERPKIYGSNPATMRMKLSLIKEEFQ